ncbi:MAG: type I DNA topoisomerase [Bacteroidetes bacterium]|nr:type I DNA topoisomerase [Bacteroidota bacterium]
MKRLVVVESPTKARTIRKYLPDSYQVEASMGHVRDLPPSASQIPEKYKKSGWSRLGVNVEDDFSPLYIVPTDKKKVVKQLKDALKDADELYIATDEDREGESIGWHLLEVLKPNVPVRRMVFHEITQTAILEALDNTREMDTNLVEAQETRRILDRLVGYSISPLLWKKIAPKLSAGRVQSVAVRLLVMRETQRILFVPAGYWGISAFLSAPGGVFEASMFQTGGLRLATGKDFDDNTGRLIEGVVDGKDCVVLSERKAHSLESVLPSSKWLVQSVEEKTTTRNPSAPFITSTLQQEASRKLRLSARETMQVAQKLYEQGFITYMRTDSTNLSNEALKAARNAIEMRYGKEYLSDGIRQFANNVRNAQEAHEAIRPAGTEMRTASELRLQGEEAALYDLIWKRTVASQMAEARIARKSVQIGTGSGADESIFRASGQTVLFPGFFRAYVEGSDDPDAALEDRDQPLPNLKKGDTVRLESIEAKGHATKPPARFTDASIIKVLEQEGIGRPSTYASIIDTIVRRGYVRRDRNQLIPTFTAFATNNLLELQFSSLVDTGFTAEMEQVLDDIADGKKKALPYLKSFFTGKDGLEAKVADGLDRIDAREVSGISFEKWNPYIVRVGKFGPYVELGEGDSRQVASIPFTVSPGDLTAEELGTFLSEKERGDDVLGIHPTMEMPVFVKKGPFGHYVQLGDDEQEGKPKRISIPKTIDPSTVDFNVAVKLLELPRELGNHPESGKVIKTNIGRFGPYVQHASVFASLTKDDDVLTIGFDRALELLLKKESKSKPLRTIGEHPETGEPIEVWEGRYGPYIKHQRVNASLTKDQTIESVTIAEALLLINERASKAKAPGSKKRSPSKAKASTTAKAKPKGSGKKKSPAKKKKSPPKK